MSRKYEFLELRYLLHYSSFYYTALPGSYLKTKLTPWLNIFGDTVKIQLSETYEFSILIHNSC